ncbi:hypothetical protein KY290_000694 [Solanum tuberosum]|uniref:Uncharacterized protein n=1 Tax=Solanum tuberosum TaxID=4113 RepID=A0ABQ7WLG6_SOLTU|nr:hypothetical protein KY289_000752 [Solanum tuberosum]KAH0781096.1 hypothetical protein KY290_000694 [Solanum tuberosum]
MRGDCDRDFPTFSPKSMLWDSNMSSWIKGESGASISFSNSNCSFGSLSKILTHTYRGVLLSTHIVAPTSNKKFYASGKKCSWWMQDKGLPVNVGAILKQNMLKFRTNKRCHLYYGSIITRYLRALQIEEEVHDVSPPPPLRAPHLVCRLVDVTRTKAHDPSQGPVLTIIDRQAPEDSWLGRMFGMAELQLQIGGRQVTEDEMATLAERYLLMDSAMYMCRMGPAFQEPIDDDDATSDEEDGSVEDESDDTGPRDDDTDTGDGDGNAASMDIDFSTNVATR